MAWRQVDELCTGKTVNFDIIQPDIHLAVCLSTHGVDGIGTKVHYDLLDLGWISEHQPDILIDMKPYLYCWHQSRPQELEAFTHHKVNRNLLSLLLTLSTEGKYLLDQIFASQTGFEDNLQ